MGSARKSLDNISRCGKCSATATGATIQCDICSTWYHIRCAGLTKSQYDVISHITSTIWTCVNCDRDILLADLKNVKLLQTQFNALSNDFNEFRKDTSIFQQEIRDLLSNTHDTVPIHDSHDLGSVDCETQNVYHKSTALMPPFPFNTNYDLGRIITSSVTDYMERQEKSHNLAIFNVTEKPNESEMESREIAKKNGHFGWY